MAERSGFGRAQNVDGGAIAHHVDVERRRPPRDRRPEGFARFIRPAKYLLGERRGGVDRAVQHPPAPAINVELGFGARPRLGPRLPRLHEGGVRILRGNERQVRVVEHRMHDDRTGDNAAAIGAGGADRAAGVQQAPFFREERRHLFEHLPLARSLLPALSLRAVGQVQRKPARHRARGIVQFDARGQALGRQAGLRPDQKGRVGRRWPGGRRVAREHQRVETFDAIDLGQRLRQLEPDVGALVDDLGRVTFGDHLSARACRGVHQRRIEHD